MRVLDALSLELSVAPRASKVPTTGRSGAEDEVDLGDADRIVRQDLEEREDEGGGDDAPHRDRGRSALAAGVPGELQRIGARTRRGDVAQPDLSLGDEAWFDMHGLSSPCRLTRRRLGCR